MLSAECRVLSLALLVAACPAGAAEAQAEADYVILRAADYQRVVYLMQSALQQLHVQHGEIHKLRADNERLRVELYRCTPGLHPPPAPAVFRLSPVVRF